MASGIWDVPEDTTYQQAGTAPAAAQANPFDPSRVPSGVPVDWAQDFISRNPGDYHRLESAYKSGQTGSGPDQQGGSSGPVQYSTPAQQWNAQPLTGATSNQFYQLLMQRAQQPTAVSRNDPNIRAQVDPAVAQQERASRGYLNQVAEQAGPLANIQGERRLASERSGQAAGALESEIIGREMAANRDQQAQALGLWGNQLQSDQGNALGLQLAQMSDAARTQDRSQGMDQFLRELALRQWIAGDQSAQGWAGFGA